MRQDFAPGGGRSALSAVARSSVKAAAFGAALLQLVVASPPAKAQQVLWDANGSAVAQGLKAPATVTFTFATPRGDFASQGAQAGQLLLQIERDGQSFSGMAYAFRSGCAPESYEVSGSISANEKVLTLKGRAPARDASCRIVAFSDQTVVVSQAIAPPVVHATRPTSTSEQCALRPAASGVERYCASSVLPPQFGNSYQVQNLFAGSSTQAWVEGQAGQGIGEWIVVEFNSPRLASGLVIENGYQKDQHIYSENSRVQAIEVRFSQGYAETFLLADRFGAQTIAFAKPTVASWVQIIIRNVYPGSRYTDTAISKLFVQSTAAN
jgi:hypothetical protein